MMNQVHHRKQTFEGKRIKFTGTQSYKAPMDRIFPFLCPVREHEYILSWDCDIVYLESGFAEDGGVFTTQPPGDREGRDVWVISRYEPSHAIEFVRVNALRAMVYRVVLRAENQGGTSVIWEQLITGLTEEGNRHIERIRESEFKEMLGLMEKLLQHYLDTGEMMRTQLSLSGNSG